MNPTILLHMLEHVQQGRVELLFKQAQESLAALAQKDGDNNDADTPPDHE